MANAPSTLERGELKFLMIDCPNNTNLDIYLKEFKTHNVTHLVRACESTYDKKRVEAAGVAVFDMPFDDGGNPPAGVIDSWLAVCSQAFGGKGKSGGRVAIHCVAGLGRTAALVAIALIEDGMEPLDAVTLIRARRRGAINAKQLQYLQAYKPRSRRGKGCCLM